MAETFAPDGWRVSSTEMRCRLCGLMVQRTELGTVQDGLDAHRYVVHGIPAPSGRTRW